MEDFNYDSTFDWVDKCDELDVQEDGVELLRIIDSFDTFPNNLYHAKSKRLELLKTYKQDILDMDITSVTVAHVATQWLAKLEGLILIGEHFGKNRWYQKEIRKRIKNMKKFKEDALNEISNSNNYWYNMNIDEMMEPWRK